MEYNWLTNYFWKNKCYKHVCKRCQNVKLMSNINIFKQESKDVSQIFNVKYVNKLLIQKHQYMLHLCVVIVIMKNVFYIKQINMEIMYMSALNV